MAEIIEVHEPGDHIYTMAKGVVTEWEVLPDGTLMKVNL